jgi:hypothetical protein
MRDAQDLIDSYDGDLDKMRHVAQNAKYALLSDAAYQDLSEGEIIGSEWQVKKVVNKYTMGGRVSAVLFESKSSGEAVLAFRGSDGLMDWGATNLPGLISHLPNPVSPARSPVGQSAYARELAAELAREYPDIAFTGHSLGGRLAKVAAMETDSKAIVFDTAPLSKPEKQKFDSQDWNIHGFRAPADVVSLFTSIRDSEVHNFPAMERSRAIDKVAKTEWLGGISSIAKGISAATEAFGYDHYMTLLSSSMQAVETNMPWINCELLQGEQQQILPSGKTFAELDEQIQKATGGLTLEVVQLAFQAETGQEVSAETLDLLFNGNAAEAGAKVTLNRNLHVNLRDILNSNRPSTVEEARAEGWQELPQSKNAFHDPSRNIKFVGPNGHCELVINPQNDIHEKRDRYRESFNFRPPSDGTGHTALDIIPYGLRDPGGFGEGLGQSAAQAGREVYSWTADKVNAAGSWVSDTLLFWRH